MKNIQQYFNYLFTLERSGMKYDLVNIRRMLNKLGNPHNSYQSIHIAGTNGKGATASFIASILMEHGLNVGLFTSPHILRFNERIRINGKCIPDTYIKDFLDRSRKLIRNIKPSFFEVNTAMAFEYFAKHNVDVAVVECGLGGRLDSTNVLFPSLSIITQIGMDHMQYLGNTLRKIALEKIGIVKPGVEVIVSDNNKTLKNIFKKVIDKQSLYYLNDRVKIREINKANSYQLNSKEIDDLRFTISLPGAFQARNAAAAITASVKFLSDIGIKPSRKCIQKGLSKIKTNTGYRGRLESIKVNNTEYVLDVSHNPAGFKETRRALMENSPDIVIFGIMEDKDINSSLPEVVKISKNILFTRVSYKRAADPHELLKKARKITKANRNLLVSENINYALEMLNGIMPKPKRILITGSFFLVGEAIKLLKMKNKFK